MDWLYIAGLILVILYLFMGLDDFIWDIVAIIRKYKHKEVHLDMNKVNNTPNKLIAVMIAAWHEENVLEEVIDNFVESTIYPKDMYQVFLGLYPNDNETLEVGRRLENKYNNVHIIVNELPGPTSKAQNINYIIKQIKVFEDNTGWKFKSFTVHDSEDVVHPYELKVTNYLIEEHGAIQFPVFPIIEKPKFSNFFRNITTATYADEFAENHFLTMVNRNNMKAFVPSAGTGFSLRRDVIESFESDEVLPNNSLTEDYRLSLTLYEKNIPLYYVLESLSRVNEDMEIVNEYITTRSIFPKTFKAAVRQKTRWITGITMQSVSFNEIFSSNKMSFVGKYSLYKDQKAKIGNLLAFIGYPVFIYFLISLFKDLPVIYPKYSLSWYLCVMVTIMMVERQLFRGISIFNVYGIKSVFFGCLFPPILPLRIIWGNLINFTATVKSYRQKYFAKPKSKEEHLQNAVKVESEDKDKANKKEESKVLKWDKTDHAFLEKSILYRYHRKIGDILIERGILTSKQLQLALKMKSEKCGDVNLGRCLVENKLITEKQLLDSLSELTGNIFIKTEDFSEFLPLNTSYAKKEDLFEHKILPIMNKEGELVIAISEYTSQKAIDDILNRYNVKICFATTESINAAIEKFYNADYQTKRSSLIELLYKENKISAQQALNAIKISMESNLTDKEILELIGLN